MWGQKSRCQPRIPQLGECQRPPNPFRGVSLLNLSVTVPREVPRAWFREDINNHLTFEPLVDCSECGRKMHQVCALWSKELGRPFVCRSCRRSRDSGLFPAHRMLRELVMLAHMLQDCREPSWATFSRGVCVACSSPTRKSRECRGSDLPSPPVFVRVLSIRDKAVEVRPGMRAYYAASDPMPDSLPYKTKAFFVFQRIDECDVCFFG